MAHGWNSYYHNLHPMSPDPGASRRTSDTEGTLSNYIGPEFSNSVTSHNHITNSNYCTDYYPSTDTANSSSGYVYQRYSGETRWQADEQTENTSSDWISTNTGSMTYPAASAGLMTDSVMPSENNIVWAQNKMDSPGNTVDSTTGNEQSVPTCCSTAEKIDTALVQSDYDKKPEKKIGDFTQEKCSNISRSPRGNTIGDGIAERADNNSVTMTITELTTLLTDENIFSDETGTQEAPTSENEHEVKSLDNKADKNTTSSDDKPKNEMFVEENGFLKNEIDTDPSHETVTIPSEDSLPSNNCGNYKMVHQRDSSTEGMTKDSLSPDSGDSCEVVSQETPPTENQALSNCFEASSDLHSLNTNAYLHLANGLDGQEQKTGEMAETDTGELSSTNDSPDIHLTGKDVSQETKMTILSEQNTTTSSADQDDCGSSGNNEPTVGSLLEFLQPVTPDLNEVGISIEPEPDAASSMTSGDKAPSAFKSMETYLQVNTSNTDEHFGSDMEWTGQELNPNPSPVSDQQDILSEQTNAEEKLCPCDSVSDNAPVEELSTEETTLSDALYGEPLSREDSSCDPDETEHDASQNIDGDKCGDNEKFHSEQQELKLLGFEQLKMLLHPIVILKKMESTDGRSHFYYCAKCSHTTLNVDGLIAHHHCSHEMAHVHFCRTCHFYQIGNGQAEKHVCSIISKQMELSSEERQQKETKLGRHKCNRCGKRFSRIIPFIQHMRTHTGKTPFRCNGCGLYFAQACSLTRHKKAPGRCKQSILSAAYPDTVGSRNKMPPKNNRVEKDTYKNIQECYVKLIDIARTTQCYICGKRYPSLAKTNKHLYAVHNMKSVSRSLKDFAIKTHSKMDKKHKCLLCTRVFKYSFNRNRHLRECVRSATYNGKGKVSGNYKCPLCSATFSLPNNRYRHIKRSCLRECLHRLAKENQKTDTEPKILEQGELDEPQPEEDQQEKLSLPPSTPMSEPRYRCGLCPAVFHHPSGKYKHKKKHELYKVSGKMIRYRKSIFSVMPKSDVSSSTKTETKKESLASMKENNPVMLRCNFCDKYFSSSQSLKKHHLKHRGDKPFHCLECGRSFKKRCYLVGHRTVHQKKIQCTECRKILPSIGELIQHRSQHPNKGLLKCPECPQEFPYPVYLRRHFTTHRNKENKPDEMPSVKPQQSLEWKEQTKSSLQCSLCNEEFDDDQALRKHSFTHIKGSSSNLCPFCERPFSCRPNLLRHMLQHTGKKPFSCTNCGKQFFRKIFMKLHSEKCLPRQTDATEPMKTKNPYFCSICPRSFCKKTRLKNHYIAHRKNTLLQCSNCGQCYSINRFGKHLQGCNETPMKVDSSPLPSDESSMKCTAQISDVDETPPQSNTPIQLPLKCPHCPKRFRFKSILLRHLVSHTGVQPYACAHCQRRFGTQNMCMFHEKLCGANSKDRQLESRNEAPEDPPNTPPIEKTADHSQVDSQTEYKCKFCTKTFTKPRSLRRHILTHNEVKPYRCKTCDGCFSRHDHLKVHQSRCKGRKRRLEICIPKISLDDVGKGWQMKFGNDLSDKKDAFDCDFCRRTFSSHSKLSRHVTMFHTTKLFKCSRCGSAFSHEKSLKKHRKVNKCRRSSMKESAVAPDGTESAVENVTGQRVTLPRILQRIHPKPNTKHKFGCTYCPRVFSNGSHLAVHIRLHTGEKPYSCNYCGLKFVRKDYLQRHFQKCSMKRQQSNVLCDRCDRCGSFFPAGKLENHKRSCSPTSGSSTSMTKWMRQSTPDSPPRCFTCAYCSNRFLLFSQLQEHFMASHKLETMEPPLSTAPLQQHLSNMPNDKEEKTNARPSDVAFSAKEKSSRHESKVLQEFFCFECNTSFLNKAGLMGHMRTHRNINPINCKICKKSFGNRTLLRNHFRKCKKMDAAAKQPEGPLKATLEFALNDSVLVFKEKSETTGSGVLQTNFSCKDGLSDESSQDSGESQIQSSSSKEKKEVQYQCSECRQTFTDGLMLISHLEDHGRQEQEKKRNTCTRCGRVCSNQANLEKHMKIHGMSKKYACPQCSKMFFTVTDLEEHKSCHDPNKKYYCKICFQRFWTRPSLCNHYSEEHGDDAFTCQFCSKTYAAKKSLARHYKKWHPMEQKECKRIGYEKGSDPQNPNSKVSTGGESEKEENDIGDEDSDSDLAPYFPCHVCGKTFTTSENLEDHQLCHLGEKPHECAECGKCFFQASQLQQHQRKHQSEFQCPTCGKGFVTRFALRRHKQGHIKIHPYRCSRCHLTFKCQSQLAEHMHTHREDNFPCDICNEVFVSKSSRAEHRKSHTVFQDCPPPPVSQAEKEPPAQVSQSSLGYSTDFKYRCGLCQERFRDPEELSEHGCKAAKERPHSCPDCNKHFLHTSDLKKHRISHLRTRSDTEYPCNQCKTAFYSTKDFLNHLNNPDDIVVEIKRESDDEGVGPIPTFICPVCHKCFPSGMELIYHFPTHPDGAYKCEKIVPPKDRVQDHSGSSRTPAVAMKCTDCGQSFSGDAFRRHSCSRQKQTVAKTKFSEPSSGTCCQNEEAEVAGEELYKCPACSKQFTSKRHLLEHQSMDHSDGNTFRCEICRKSFARRRYLTRHKHIHSQKETVSHTRQPQQRVLNCPRCSASFSTKQDLSKHMRRHAENEVGVYRCDMCYKSFSLWSLLRQHQESHVGEVVYECTECDKAFAFPHLLDEHQQTHAGSSK